MGTLLLRRAHVIYSYNYPLSRGLFPALNPSPNPSEIPTYSLRSHVKRLTSCSGKSGIQTASSEPVYRWPCYQLMARKLEMALLTVYHCWKCYRKITHFLCFFCWGGESWLKYCVLKLATCLAQVCYLVNNLGQKLLCFYYFSTDPTIWKICAKLFHTRLCVYAVVYCDVSTKLMSQNTIF